MAENDCIPYTILFKNIDPKYIPNFKASIIPNFLSAVIPKFSEKTNNISQNSYYDFFNGLIFNRENENIHFDKYTRVSYIIENYIDSIKRILIYCNQYNFNIKILENLLEKIINVKKYEPIEIVIVNTKIMDKTFFLAHYALDILLKKKIVYIIIC